MNDLQVPKEWKLDPDWDGEPKIPQQPNHLRKYPSKWRAASSQQDPVSTVRIVDRFVIQQTPDSETQSSNGEVSNSSGISTQ